MAEEQKLTTCLSCKITSISCLFGIGAYLMNTARTQQKNSKSILILLGAGSIFLGVGEIFDVSPFRNYDK